MGKMDIIEMEKAKAHLIVGLIDYVHDSIVIKLIFNKPTGNIKLISIDDSKVFNAKIIPFDTFIQIIDGQAEVIIDGIPNIMNVGHSIIVPAHSSNVVKAHNHLKMILTVIKSGYE